MKSYTEVALEIAKLVTEKQQAYGDSFSRSGEVLKILYPDGVKPDQLGDVLVLVRVLDKLFRVATNNDPMGEDPWRDVAGYALLAVTHRQTCIRTSTQEVP